MLYITHTLIGLTISFVLPNHKQFIRVNRMLYIAHNFIWNYCRMLLKQHYDQRPFEKLCAMQ